MNTVTSYFVDMLSQNEGLMHMLLQDEQLTHTDQEIIQDLSSPHRLPNDTFIFV